MRRELILHPAFQRPAVTAIAVEVARPTPTSLTLRFTVAGEPRGLRLPPPSAPARTDGLWAHTCFEAFARSSAGDIYYELNIAPSSAWAAYRFDGYRAGMTPVAAVAPPRFALRPTPGGFELEAAFDLIGALDLPIDGPWRLGASAVIEAADGAISYWALAHPPGRPDFHHADCFALELAATGQA